MKKYILFAILALSISVIAQNVPISGYCTRGGVGATTQGMSSINFLQGIIPSCTVAIYISGSSPYTLATLYTQSGGAQANPFTAANAASSNPGYWIVYAPAVQAYDIVLSGGIAPNTYPSPITLEAYTLPLNTIATALASGTYNYGSGSVIVNANTANTATTAATATTATTATHALNLPADLATQSAASPAAGTFTSLNGTVQADQFSGADMCAKIKAAATYAIANSLNQVDATHFSGTQACATNMLGGIAASSATSANLVVNLGTVHIQSTVVQTITNSGVKLRGMGPMQTRLEYTGSSGAVAVLSINDNATCTYGISNDQVEDIFLYGGNGNVTDGLLLSCVHHSQFRNIWTWGVTGCGIHGGYTVTDSFYDPRTSKWDAIALGIYGASHTQPASGLCFAVIAGSGSTYGATDHAIVNPAAEYLSGTGWALTSAINLEFYGGTSEYNNMGTTLASGTSGISFWGSWFEGNSTSYDVLDNGTENHYYNTVAGGIELGATSLAAVIDGGQFQTGVKYDVGSSRYRVCYAGACTDYTHNVTQSNGYQVAGSQISSSNLSDGPFSRVMDVSGTNHGGHSVVGFVTPTSTTYTITFSGSAVWTSASTYSCWAVDDGTHLPLGVVTSSSTSATIYGTTNGNGTTFGCSGY